MFISTNEKNGYKQFQRNWEEGVPKVYPLLPKPYSIMQLDMHGGITPSGGRVGFEDPITLNKLIENGSFWGTDYLHVNARNNTWNRALNKLDDKLTNIENLFETWYERREAYSMIGTVLQELVNFTLNWKKAAYWKAMKKAAGKALKRPETMPEAWLTYHFGIYPLVQSLDTALHLLDAPFPNAYTSGSATRTDHFIVKPYTIQKGILSMKGTERIKLGCIVKPRKNPNSGLLAMAGLTTPLSTMWSVLPWGWAIDYFLDVSAILSNLEVKHPGIEQLGFYKSTKRSYHIVTALPDYATGQYGDYTTFSREIIPQPTYRVAFNLPLLGTNSFANLASAVALAMKKG